MVGQGRTVCNFQILSRNTLPKWLTAPKCPLFWPGLDRVRSSRTQFGTHLGNFEVFSEVFRKQPNHRKSFSKAGLELVPGGGIEPSTHGFSVSSPEFHNFLKTIKLLK